MPAMKMEAAPGLGKSTWASYNNAMAGDLIVAWNGVQVQDSLGLPCWHMICANI
jgi:hypothetical protein